MITGISGKFPNSENVQMLQHNLLNKIDCVNNENPRWECNNPHVPSRTGKIKEITKFDRIFFGVHPKVSNAMIPEMRMITECTYEAVADAGINPRQMRGSKTSVYTATTFSESEKALFYEKFEQNSIVGTSRSMLANRISFFLGLVGQSINIDASCCGSLTALEQAYLDIKNGRSDSAIVGGASLALHPYLSLHMSLLGLLSPDGRTKAFDNDANGYARGESIVAVFLQRARDANRIYAEVKSILSLPGPTDDNLPAFYPTSEFQASVFRKSLKNAQLEAKDINYIEADGLGIKEADAQEIKAIDLVFNEGRMSPLLVGSVKTNIGYCSNSNSLNAIVKIITAMDRGMIPPNLHYKTPSNLIPAIKEGRIKVPTNCIPWEGKYAAVNTISITGLAANVILKSFKKDKKNQGAPDDNLIRLIIASGSTEESVAYVLDQLESKPVDVEMLQLLYNVFETENTGHLYKGYTLLPPRGLPKIRQRQIEYNSGSKKQIWFVYSGMGSQWVGMGEALLKLPVFEAAIRKCDAALKPRGIDIFRILTEKDPKMFDYIVNAFVGITAVQIGLTDVLHSIGIKPDYIIGHSLGELGCGYADGCITAEQMVLCALGRGLASVESDLIRGSMAAVGMSYEEIQPLCPPDIDVACHNSAESSTISGPAESMKAFIADLTAKGIFAREVACGNIAYHSRYMAPVRDLVLKYFNREIPNPKARSDKWLSTSIPRSEWGSPKARLCSGFYHMNNQLSPVYFAETAKMIPNNAIAIEIAPHGLMQAILRKSLANEVVNIPLTKRGHPDNVEILMAGLGKLYSSGLNIKISNLYPKIEYPVSSGTPSISSLIKWDHSNDWFTDFYEEPQEIKEGEMKFPIRLENTDWEFLKGHRIDNKIVIPASLYLKLVWNVLREISEERDLIVFENVQIFKHQLIIPQSEEVSLVVMVQKGTGNFEVTNNDLLLCSGNVCDADRNADVFTNKRNKNSISDLLDKNDVYDELQMRGYQYSDSFRSVINSTTNATYGTLMWRQNWTTFLDGILQMFCLGNDVRRIQLPVKIGKITIDRKFQENLKTTEGIPVQINRQLNVTIAGGIEIKGIVLTPIHSDPTQGEVIVEEMEKIKTTWNYTKLKRQSRLTQHWKAQQLVPSDPKSINWVEGCLVNDLPLEKIAKVEYSSIEASDILQVLGKLVTIDLGLNRLEPKTLGLEYSGVDSKGRQIMGLSSNGTLSNFITIDSVFTWEIPKNWSPKDAVTVPLAYTVAYNALFLKGRIKKQETILIYNGTTGFGQAAINLAKNEQSDIFVVYKTQGEKKLLQKLFPFISMNHLCQSSDTFTDQVLMRTKGKGIDLIIYNGNDLSVIKRCLCCTKMNARVVVIGELEEAFGKSVGMEIFLREISLYSVIPRKVLLETDLMTKQTLARMVADGLKSGVVKLLFGNYYEREELEKAFMDGIAEKLNGKIIVKVQPQDSNRASAITQYSCSKKGSILIIEGLNNFGLELIDFLIVRGARNIIIATNSKNSRQFSNYRMNIWRKYGVTVVLRDNCDFTKKEQVKLLLNETSKLGEIEVVFDLQRMNGKQRNTNVNNLFTRNIEEELKNYSNGQKFIICSTATELEENFNQLLEREREIVKLCEKSSKGQQKTYFIVFGPIEGNSVRNLEEEELLTIPRAIEEIDRIIGANVSIVGVTYKTIIHESQGNTNVVTEEEEDEETLFKAYLYKVDPMTKSKFKSLNLS